MNTMTETDIPDFTALAERHRRELLAHCYRLTGRRDDAEDLVQKTFERAWRAYPSFRGDSSARTWLYRIATNVCLNALESDAARPVQPLPDDLVITDAGREPDTDLVRRETIRLALIVSLQLLPPGQRAALVLCDVLRFSAAEAAGILDTTRASVKSALQRARARLSEAEPEADGVVAPDDPRAREQLDAYVHAFETADVRALERVLRDDAVLDMPYNGSRFAGLNACLSVFEAAVGAAGAWRMDRHDANGQPAVGSWMRKEDGNYVPYGIAILTPTATGLAGVTVFEDPALVSRPDHAG